MKTRLEKKRLLSFYSGLFAVQTILSRDELGRRILTFLFCVAERQSAKNKVLVDYSRDIIC